MLWGGGGVKKIELTIVHFHALIFLDTRETTLLSYAFWKYAFVESTRLHLFSFQTYYNMEANQTHKIPVDTDYSMVVA